MNKGELLCFLSNYATYRYTGPLDLSQPESAPWRGHVVFADMLVRACRPGCLVELGTYTGVSFFAFCNAVQQGWLNTRCYAVDTWKGEQHAGRYGEEVYASVSTYVERHYASFARLLRMTFDDAACRFAEESIDVLHIDGLHTYEAVRHDFDLWLPKVRPGGIILLHDVAEQRDDFGVCKLWDEIAPLADGSFCFRHSHGLGVWRKPGGNTLAQEHSLLQVLLGDNAEEAAALAALVRQVVNSMDARLSIAALERKLSDAVEASKALEEQRAGLENRCARIEQEKIAGEKSCEKAHEQLQRAYEELLNSRSWKLTRPLRDIAGWWRLFRRGK